MEMLRLSFVKCLVSRLPQRLRYRVAKALYDYESDGIRGVDVSVPYFEDLGLQFFLNTKELIGWNVFFRGEYEINTNRWLRRLVKKGDVVLEAGANNGSETVLLASLVDETGRVLAFEPIPHVVRRLRINVILNGFLDRVVINEMALGEDYGTVMFNLFPKDFCNQGMSSKYAYSQQKVRIDVAQTTVDRWLTEHAVEKLSFVKMDIQGSELDLISGATETIEAHRPTIFTEASTSWVDTGELHRAITRLDYYVFLIDSDFLIPLRDPGKLTDGNWLAFPAGSQALEAFGDHVTPV
jgi:FkbM family methyltransferase